MSNSGWPRLLISSASRRRRRVSSQCVMTERSLLVLRQGSPFPQLIRSHCEPAQFLTLAATAPPGQARAFLPVRSVSLEGHPGPFGLVLFQAKALPCRACLSFTFLMPHPYPLSHPLPWPRVSRTASCLGPSQRLRMWSRRSGALHGNNQCACPRPARQQSRIWSARKAFTLTGRGVSRLPHLRNPLWLADPIVRGLRPVSTPAN